MIDLIKPYIKIGFIALMAIIFGSLIIERSCQNPYESKEYLELKGRFTEYKAEVEEADKKREEKEAEEEAEIREILAENEALEKEKHRILEGSIELNEEIEKKSEELRILREEEETMETLKAQNSILEENFSLAIKDRDKERAARLKVEKQNKNFKISLEKKDKIIAGLHTSLANEKKLRLKCEDLVKEGEKGRLWQKFELVVTRGLAVYGLYHAGKAVLK